MALLKVSDNFPDVFLIYEYITATTPEKINNQIKIIKNQLLTNLKVNFHNITWLLEKKLDKRIFKLSSYLYLFFYFFTFFIFVTN